MNLHPVHYAPHHTGHLPLCGERTVAHGGTTQLLICTMERDEITCFKCIDQYEERALTSDQQAALNEAKRAIDEALADIENMLAFDEGKRITLDMLDHVLKAHTPWWHIAAQFRVRRAIRDLRALSYDDLSGTK